MTDRIEVFKVRMEPSASEAVARVLQSGYVGQGQVCEDFEAAFGQLVGALDPPLLTNSCTSAIDLALHLIGVGPGDEVISTPITCAATNAPVALRGAQIIWSDVDPLTGNIDPADVARKITKKTKAIIVVDWAGRTIAGMGHASVRNKGARFAMPDMVPVIEDAAHALCSLRAGLAPLGDVAHAHYICWSFQAIKHLTTGDGGALLAPHGQMERARLLRWYGLDRRSGKDFRCEQDIREIGYKYQSNDIAAAIGLANLARAEWAVARHRQHAATYDYVLRGAPGVTLPPPDPGCAYWLYSLLVDDRPSFMAHLEARGIATSQVHARNDKHRAFRAASESRGPLPGVDYFDAHQVSIPVGWWLSEQDRDRVAGAVLEWAHEVRGRAA